jgi:hypothetical protein
LIGGAAGAWAQGSPAPGKPDQAAVSKAISEWPDAARTAATEMMQKYGPPQDATTTMLVWRDNRPWKRTIVHREAVDHAFPAPHKDVLEQTVSYKVPLNFFEPLVTYNGSLVIDRTRGEITARSDRETENLLMINLAHEIVRGKRTPEDARKFHTQTIQALAAGQASDYGQKLLTDAEQQGDMSDPDISTVPVQAPRKP